MKRTFSLLILAVALGAYGCGDDTGSNNGNNGANNQNNGSNANAGTNNNNGSNSNAGTNNGSNANAGTNNNNGSNSNAGTNNGSNANAGTNNGSNANAGTNNASNNGNNNGGISVQATIRPNQGQVGSDVEVEFTTLEGITFNPDAIGMDHVEGEGHYHVYLDQVDPMYELLESGTNPDTFTLDFGGDPEITVGGHDLVFVVHKNDHTEYASPIEFTIGYTVIE